MNIYGASDVEIARKLKARLIQLASGGSGFMSIG